MHVVGISTHHTAWVASRDRPFNINEILVIDDAESGHPKAEVVETQSFNRYIPMAGPRDGLVDERVLAGLRQVGFRVEGETIHVARIRALEELPRPIKVGSRVRRPAFSEVEPLLVRAEPSRGLVLGVILGTEHMAPGLPAHLQGLAPLYETGRGVLPQGGVPFVFDHESMDQYPHIGVFGGSGSGKSFALRVLLEEFMARKIPGVAFDPHFEMSFDEEFEGLPPGYGRSFRRQTVVLRVGREVGARFEELGDSDLAHLLEAAGGSLSEAMDHALRTVHRPRDSLASFTDKLEHLIALSENQEAALERLRKIHGEHSDYERMMLNMLRQGIHGSSLRGLRWRLSSLEREGVFTSNIQPVLDGLLRRKLVVIRGAVRLLRVFAAYLIRHLYGKRREYRDALQKGDRPTHSFPPFLVVTDEAHNFAPRGLESPAKAVFREIAQEGRKYGVFLLLATQRPALLDDTITAQLNTKMVFRTVRSTDIAVLKEETDLTAEEAARLPYLSSGKAFVSSAILGRTVAIKFRVSRTRSPHSQNPFAELEEDFRSEEEAFKESVEPLLPLDTSALNFHLQAISRAVGRPVGYDEMVDWLEHMAESGWLARKQGPFGIIYTRGAAG